MNVKTIEFMGKQITGLFPDEYDIRIVNNKDRAFVTYREFFNDVTKEQFDNMIRGTYDTASKVLPADINKLLTNNIKTYYNSKSRRGTVIIRIDATTQAGLIAIIGEELAQLSIYMSKTEIMSVIRTFLDTFTLIDFIKVANDVINRANMEGD